MQAAKAQMECTWKMINPPATLLEEESPATPATPATPEQPMLSPVPLSIPEDGPQLSGYAEEDAQLDFARQQTALTYTRTSDM